MASSKRYLYWLAICFAATLLPIFVLNLLIAKKTLDDSSIELLASEWQRQTHGITDPQNGGNGEEIFKMFRLNDRLPEINTVVLGSSTMKSIRQEMFPSNMRIYNYSMGGNPLSFVIGEAEYLINSSEQIKYIIVPLDWSLGFIYSKLPPATKDLSLATAKKKSSLRKVSWTEMAQDAVTYPRIVNLFGIIRKILTADQRANMFESYFLKIGSKEYRCYDGSIAKDFNTTHRGACAGFRFDGSATWSSANGAIDAQPLIIKAMAESSRYVDSLKYTEGEPNPVFLEHLVGLKQRLRMRGGKLLIIFPPLIPGMESTFLKSTKYSPFLAKTKNKIRIWAESNGMDIIDAGQSERFNCLPAEFQDEIHARQTCYERIFKSYWGRDDLYRVKTTR